jgi:hypothetical protein
MIGEVREDEPLLAEVLRVEAIELGFREKTSSTWKPCLAGRPRAQS